MPYRYVPPPKNLSLKVLADLPDGVTEDRHLYFNHLREASGHIDGAYVAFHYCPKCKGWIEGNANSYSINTLGPLCGRSGTEYYCRRCGYEIDFWGMMS